MNRLLELPRPQVARLPACGDPANPHRSPKGRGQGRQINQRPHAVLRVAARGRHADSLPVEPGPGGGHVLGTQKGRPRFGLRDWENLAAQVPRSPPGGQLEGEGGGGGPGLLRVPGLC